MIMTTVDLQQMAAAIKQASVIVDLSQFGVQGIY